MNTDHIDPEWGRQYEAQEPGLTEWLLAAITANAVAHGVNIETAE